MKRIRAIMVVMDILVVTTLWQISWDLQVIIHFFMINIKLLSRCGWNSHQEICSCHLLSRFFLSMNYWDALGQSGNVYVIIWKIISASELCFDGYDWMLEVECFYRVCVAVKAWDCSTLCGFWTLQGYHRLHAYPWGKCTLFKHMIVVQYLALSHC